MEDTDYEGIPVGEYTANLGDASKNEDEKCYCYTTETCLKRGMMDLYKCTGVPLYASLPHFYDCHESYLKGVKGLKPNKTKHEIRILFESVSVVSLSLSLWYFKKEIHSGFDFFQFTGSPVFAAKRLQFNMPLEPMAKVDLFKNFKETIIPLFWIEEVSAHCRIFN